jgi:hypothetical protein
VELHRRLLADPTSPLGLIQRGRGAGYLWAREHPAEARPLLYSCLERDPRHNPDGNAHLEYYVELAQAVAFDARQLLPLLEARATQPKWTHPTPPRSGHRYDPVLLVLTGVALTGDPVAREAVVEAISNGAIWVALLENLLFAYEDFVEGYYKAFPDLPPWPELQEAVVARVCDHHDGQALLAERSDFVEIFATWPLWTTRTQLREWIREHDEEIREFADLCDSGEIDEIATPTKGFLDAQYARELVRAARSDYASAVELQRVLRDEEYSQRSFWTWRVLGMQGDTSVAELARERLRSEREYGPGEYLRRLPPAAALPIARELVASDHQADLTIGWHILRRHARSADVPFMYRELEGAIERGDWDRACDALIGLARRPRRGPYPAAWVCFETAPCASARSLAARVLSRTDQRFADEFAFECLWDCDVETRRLAAGVIAPATAEIRDRVAAIEAAFTRED